MVHLSEAAAREVKRLRSSRQQPNALFRLRVEASGCEGLSYALELAPSMQLQDQTFECHGIQVLVDPQSLPYVKNLQIDYAEDLMGGCFRFHNANATKTCGCGNSFSINSCEES
ncbi:hypothetical protein DO97_20460 [Neosynechococcus sphagnicola sy1]|uniref:Core domain-containing protein n=1 Tax=Neosynechococcus sphagnicola sy1 TaxID=1497020 RepID=A0A098TM93_9CYAN|nr:iron-sulfur cluster assembly accessory protein [Neosynechococcus sphagnicola]KGF73435.1 hypothetical protein DO97_20460 [Neosynechococcus sphagnicola sy1]